jgi:tripartite-type tricarboxylate transporter receptor subunit TctC
MFDKKLFITIWIIVCLCNIDQARSATTSYPIKPVRIVIPFAPGGGLDIVGRFVGSRLHEELGQQFIVDNRGGAGTTVGTEIVAKAPADGYTLLITNSGLAYSESLYPKLGYSTTKDLAAVSLIGLLPSVLVIHPSVPAKNIKELIALMRAKPGQLNYGTGGVGGAVHLAFELFQSMAGVKANHIPYKGVGPALIDTVAGNVQVVIAGMPPTISYVKAGRLHALAISGSKRSPVMPDLPTIAESGVPGYDYTIWYGMLTPGPTPTGVILQLNRSMVKALGSADLRTKLAQQGVDTESSSPEQFSMMLKEDIARWGKLIKSLGIKGE